MVSGAAAALLALQMAEKSIEIEQEPSVPRYTYRPTYPVASETASVSTWSTACGYEPIMPYTTGKCSGCAF